MAYFDNAATTFPKPECVYSFMNEFYRKNGGSAGRGTYNKAMSVKGLIEETRVLLKELFHCPSKQVIFTPTATIALNIIVQGVIRTGVKTVYISPFEHNAVTRALHYYEKNKQIKVKELHVSDSLEYDLERIKYQFDAERPELIVTSHASNVIGLIAPVEELCNLAKYYGAITVVDMAQTAGVVDINVGLESVDFAVFAGHKTLMGPTGISGFVMNPRIEFPPVLFGGTGFDSANQDMPERLPEKFEMGTMNTSGIAGLNAALKWIHEQGIDTIREKETTNRNKVLDVIGEYDFLRIVGNAHDREYVGIVSCLWDGISSDSAGKIFQEHDVSVRTGLQCAPLAHRFLGTYPEGTIRFSVSALTDDVDFQILKIALDDISEQL